MRSTEAVYRTSEHGWQAVRLTSTIRALLGEHELAGLAEEPVIKEVLLSGDYFIEELEAVVHRQREYFDFDAHGSWVQMATAEEIALQGALDLLRSGEVFDQDDPALNAVAALESARLSLWMRMDEVWASCHLRGKQR